MSEADEWFWTVLPSNDSDYLCPDLDAIRHFDEFAARDATARIAFVPPECLADNEKRIGIAILGGSLDHRR